MIKLLLLNGFGIKSCLFNYHVSIAFNILVSEHNQIVRVLRYSLVGLGEGKQIVSHLIRTLLIPFDNIPPIF